MSEWSEDYWQKIKGDPERLAVHRASVAAAMRETRRARKADPALQEKHLRRQRAQKAVQHALRTGALVRPDKCEECGSGGKPDAHHPDYEQRLLVQWVCRPCHNRIHRAHRAALRAAVSPSNSNQSPER